MTKKPTAAEIEAAQKALDRSIRNAFPNETVICLDDASFNTIDKALAWCAEQEKKGE